MPREHRYAVQVRWTGNRGAGTADYRAYERSHEITAVGKPALTGSADAAFLGDAAHWNPEDMLVAALSACHMLWYLHLCADAGVVVTRYHDRAEGLMEQGKGGGGRFVRVVLRPEVEIAVGSDVDKARALHEPAHEKCFIAASMNFPVAHEPTIGVAG
ncbi:MAG: OsmC family peroxiredoxin [Alphaproteobacteria bacterium]|jgi:organic hydroperoxide reductase OsmC/OhrA|nr:OsmC family peroxiredoxin [Alphaproteobacteria bacterium]